MKLAILIARSSEDRGHASVVESPMPYDQAAKFFKKHVAAREMPAGCASAGFNVLELWTSTGRAKHHKFSRPAVSVRPVGAVVDANQSAAKEVPPAKTKSKGASSAESGSVKPNDGDGSVISSVDQMAARLEAGDTVTAEDLSTLTVPQLRQLADRYQIDIPSDAKKEDIVVLLLADE